MAKKKINKKERNKERLFVYKFVLIIGAILALGIATQNLIADQITFKFKSPSFSGIGTSSHYLTIENQEYTHRYPDK